MTNRLSATCWMVVCGIALLISCGGKDSHGTFVPPSDNGGAAGATSHRAGALSVGGAGTGALAGDAGSGGGNSLLAPVIKITAPPPASDPNGDEVLIDDQVTVVCKATKSTANGAAAVDASTVKIAMLDPSGKELKSVSGTPTANANEYSAAFVLEAVPNGSLSFGCTASDSAAHAGSVTIDTLVDHGPEIDVIQPEKLSAHNLLAPMALEFDTAPAPIAKGDAQADVSSVTATVYGVDIKPTAAGGGKYRATVDFTKFDAKPTGSIPVVLTASNSRKAPGKATQSISYTVVIDGSPPVVTLVTPVAQDVVGRATILKFSATDSGAGIDTTTATVTIDNTPFVYSATNGKWTVDTTGLFTFQFGAEIKGQSNTQVTVNVSVGDKASNTGKAAAIFNLDNQPPIVDMDPPNLYEATIVDADTKQCSDYFDPLGTEAPNDLETVTNFNRFRALVYDTTNTKAGQTDFFYALTDRSSVQIFVQDDKNTPLLADTDDPPDHICDDIWTGTPPYKKHPTDKPIPFDGLHVVALNSYRGAVTYPNPKANSPLGVACSGGVESTAPKLCKSGSSDMSVVIHHGVGKDEPVIYAIDPIDNNDVVLCTGQTWDITTAITMSGGAQYLGWVCVAARAVDKVGNVGISKRLRVCLDDGTNPHRCDTEAPPSCTDDCTAPPHFNAIVQHD